MYFQPYSKTNSWARLTPYDSSASSVTHVSEWCCRCFYVWAVIFWTLSWEDRASTLLLVYTVTSSVWIWFVAFFGSRFLRKYALLNVIGFHSWELLYPFVMSVNRKWNKNSCIYERATASVLCMGCLKFKSYSGQINKS